MPTPRTEAIARMFRSAGLRARLIKNVDAYQKTHAAGLPALAGALYMAGVDIRRLARRPELLRLFVQAYREALRALRADGTRLSPPATPCPHVSPLFDHLHRSRPVFATKPLIKRPSRIVPSPRSARDITAGAALAEDSTPGQRGRGSPARDHCFCRCPSQSSNPSNTLLKASGRRVPSLWTARTAGNVVTPWTRTAPGFRNSAGADTSKGELRRLIVCGTTVIRSDPAPQTPR